MRLKLDRHLRTFGYARGRQTLLVLPRFSILGILTALLLAALLAVLVGNADAQAQGTDAVQQLTGDLELRTGDYYTLHDLEQGQAISVFAEATSGNLDAFVGIVDYELDGEELLAAFRGGVEQALADGLDPTSAIREVSDELFLAWNDDGDRGSSANLTFNIPVDGDYRLLIYGSPGQNTFGNYRMLIGLDASDVTTGRAQDTGDEIATFDTRIPAITVAVDEINGAFNEDKHNTMVKIRDMAAGDTVYAVVEAVSGELRPVLTLQNYRGKPILTDNYTGESTTAALQYTVLEDTSNLYWRVTGCCGEDAAGGEYRLLVGVNAPEVLTGEAEATEALALVSPKIVEIGVKLDQITSVDQVSENYGAVIDLRLEWDDPRLAFDPDGCNCAFQTYTPSAFTAHLEKMGVEEWPVTTLYNQQGRRDEQGNTVVVMPDGHAIAVLRFTATMQAPDFDFRQFPFDRQSFHIRLRSVFPEEFFIFKDLENFTELGKQLGEEEWVISDWGTSVDTSEGSSRYNFTFSAVRHLEYYIYRIFLPLLIIILVSWAIFFLRNYEKRVDAAAGNLLLLIAFNFTISGNLPKLGYLTLMDVVLITTFVVTGLVLVLNVYLKRMEVAGKRERAERIDKYVLWLYPVIYIVMIGGIAVAFFVIGA